MYSVGRKFRKLKTDLSLNVKYNLKIFRKTIATELIKKIMDGTQVAHLPGHTSVNTTSKYYINQNTENVNKKLNSIGFDIMK